MLTARRMSRRNFLKIGGAGLAGAALLGTTGCGGGQERTGGATNLVFSFGPDDSGTMVEVIDRFNKEYRGEIFVEHREMPSDTGAYFNQLRTEFQAGASPVDVIGGDVIWPPQFAANGWVLDLSDRFTEEMRSRYLEAPITSVTYEGKVYGVPWFTDGGMLYYRKDLLEESGFSEPPETWDELKEMAIKIREDSGVDYGFIFQGAEYEGGVVNGLEYIYTHGGEVLADSGRRAVADQPEAIAGLRTERSMIDSGAAPISVVAYKEPETHTTFPAGRAVFARNWPYMYGIIADPTQSQITPEQMGIAPIPHAEGSQSFSGLGGWIMMINAASKDKVDAAWEFITFAAMEPEQQRFRAIEGGFLPPLKFLYEDPEIMEKVPVARFAKESLQNAKPRPVSPFYSDMSLAMAEKFAASLRGEISPEQAARQLKANMAKTIKLGQQLLA